MPLVLTPSFDDHTRAEIEAHLAQVQARRMLASIEYHTGKDAKLEHESDKIQRRVEHQYLMLGKEIEQLDRIHAKVEDRLASIEHLKNELGLVMDMRELHQVPTEKEDD